MVEDKKQPEGTYTLTRMQVAAVSDVQRAATEIAARRKEWAEWEHKTLIPAEQAIAKKSAEVFDELCEAHGIERDGRSVVVSKDLTTFTLEEPHGQEKQESESAGNGGSISGTILDANGQPLRSAGGLDLQRGLTPGNPGERITAEGAGQLLERIGAANG